MSELSQPKMLTVEPAFALRYAQEVFQACAAPAEEAWIVADHLVTASLMGYDTHGMMRIPQYVEDVRNFAIKPGAPARVEKETATTAVVNCGWNFGQVGGLRAVEIAMAKAGQAHTATVVTQACQHVGRLGAYTQKAAEHGFLAIAVCNSPLHGHFVLPWGGREGRLATNPISFAVPSETDFPILADFSTAESSEGRIRLYRNLGKALPEGWIVDANGKPSTGPGDFYGPPPGAILPFGGDRGYRGFALGLLVEVLGGLLSGARITVDQHGNGLGLILVDVSAFMPREQFSELIREMRAYIKSSAPAPGVDEVYLPGEPDLLTMRKRQKEGLPIDEKTWEQIMQAGSSLGVEWRYAAPRLSLLTRGSATL